MFSTTAGPHSYPELQQPPCFFADMSAGSTSSNNGLRPPPALAEITIELDGTRLPVSLSLTGAGASSGTGREADAAVPPNIAAE